ncbi:IMP-specific 5'-nucleotidase 1 [Monoraphidium neglectum]|uniref:IMP-specific 5'-nucleotidase 1 n=1 Tax=Monoraphidium neglectum TaxID=145388 RepID=A0A0D2JPP2_9CHLO|nr:IMP-specific 5'-nucleotidase 1 [Monoraphidium neglectum]KIZ01088.1 IMP-specific 5'-nucleotidase 1 [Monoraphidium neglectum]|eukprot:XP_013900107.1 IMP-specific 5'-nucleotidase 1 [Monoraphidium neglectum]
MRARVAALERPASGSNGTGVAGAVPVSTSDGAVAGAAGPQAQPTIVAHGRAESATPGATPFQTPGSSAMATPVGGSPATSAVSVSPASTGSALDLGEAAGYWELLLHPDTEASIPRAKSASDASLLRRKGHLKEQDRLIEYIRQMHETHTCEEAMYKTERWIADHRQDPRRSRLKRIVPTVGSFFTPLKLVEAFREYDAFFHLSRRRYIPPNFAELRHILNIAQVHASAESLRLITFDADGTLYADGCHIEQDSEMIRLMVSLMRLNVHVGIVTAAGYPGDASKFEGRIEGLLSAFRRLRLPPEIAGRFHLMGGECNYLLRVDPSTCRLEFVPDEEWQTAEMRAWSEEDIRATLDEAQVRGGGGCTAGVSWA